MRLLIMAALLSLCASQAQAAHHHHQRHDYSQRRISQVHHRGAAHAAISYGGGGGVVTVSTAAGPIMVASHLADRFRALIADFVAHGYTPRHIGCAAHGGHVQNSRHYHGAACDFDQGGWGKTAGFMHHAHEIIARHGFRDGCSFGDCGHVDDGRSTHSRLMSTPGAMRIAPGATRTAKVEGAAKPALQFCNRQGQRRYSRAKIGYGA